MIDWSDFDLTPPYSGAVLIFGETEFDGAAIFFTAGPALWATLTEHWKKTYFPTIYWLENGLPRWQ